MINIGNDQRLVGGELQGGQKGESVGRAAEFAEGARDLVAVDKALELVIITDLLQLVSTAFGRGQLGQQLLFVIFCIAIFFKFTDYREAHGHLLLPIGVVLKDKDGDELIIDEGDLLGVHLNGLVLQGDYIARLGRDREGGVIGQADVTGEPKQVMRSSRVITRKTLFSSI